MGFKKIFNRDAETKVVSLTNKTDAAENIESPDYYSAKILQKNRFEPHIDYASASNFAKFGSAEKYYTDTIANIYTYYPFDGSFYEKVEWELSASGIQKYIFDNEYPRTNGYIDFSYGGWGSTSLSTGSATVYVLPTNTEYINVKGGPNKDPEGTGKTLASIFAASSSNFYDVSEDRESNLELGNGGNTVEWWMKKDGFVSAGQQEVVFDMWASGSAPDLSADLIIDGGILDTPRGIDVDVGGEKIYFSSDDTGEIQTANLDGTDAATFLVTTGGTKTLAINHTTSKIYYGLFSVTGAIATASLDGTPGGSIFGAGVGDMGGMAVDETNEHLYFAHGASDDSIIQRCGLDGSGVTTIIPDINNQRIGAVSVDPTRSKLYWSAYDNGEAERGIWRSNLDGTSIEQIWSGSRVSGMDVDIPNAKVYFIGGTTSPTTPDALYRANLDGTFPEILLEGLEEGAPAGLALGGGYAYWTNFDVNKIYRANTVDSYGRFTVLINSSSAPIHLTYASGAGGINASFGGPSAPTTASIADANWHHYAVSADATTGRAELYVDGVYKDYVEGGPISEVAGALIANVGSYYGTRASDNLNVIFTGSMVPGWCKLSASIDEFRFWKTARTDKQIGMNWFTQVGGGTNQDDANTGLGVYYKFNEGISLTASVDAKVLDYSGRFSDGTWTGYTAGARNTGSAMVLAGAAKSEFKDPIIYSFHPSVVSLLEEKQKLGQEYDYQNASSIYNSIPGWIIDEDNGNLTSLVQIISSFFDSMQLKIENLSSLKDIGYLSSSVKPYPFTDNALESLGFMTPSLFIEADVLEAIANRSDTEEFEEQLYNIKNLIYQNIYNNLTYIYNTKGTMKSFRNLIRCYGIDEELVRVNLYVDGQTFKLEDDYKLMALEKKFVNFAGTDRFNGTVYMTASNSSEADYFSASTFNHPLTYESQVVVPSKFPRDSTLWFETPFISASLFGQHEVTSADPYTWASGNDNNFQVYLVKEEVESNNAKFVLTTTDGGVLPTLTSPIYKDVYDNSNWNIAVKVRPQYALHDIATNITAFPATMMVFSDDTNYDILTASMPGFTPSGIIYDGSKTFNWVSVDDTNEKIYWSNTTSDEIQSASFDGSNETVVLTTTAVTAPQLESVKAIPSIDKIIYGLRSAGGTGRYLYTADLDGANADTICSNTQADSKVAYGCYAYCEANGKVYFRSDDAGGLFSAGTIFSCSIDGTSLGSIGVEDATPLGTGNNTDMVISGDTIYWTVDGDLAGALIFTASIDGTNFGTLLSTATISKIKNISVDTVASKIYVSDDNDGKIYSLDMDGTGLAATAFEDADMSAFDMFKQPSATGSAALAGSGTLEFQGVQTEGDFVRNEFLMTASLSPADLTSFVQNPSKFYAGAHYTNFTGSLLEQTDVKITNNRVWYSYLPPEVIRVHAKDSTNYGTLNPYNDAYNAYDEISSPIPEVETLALSWGYDTLSSSDDGSGPGYTAGFMATDLHTSSAERDYGVLAPMLTSSHPGRGDFFLANDDDVIQKEYLSNAKLQGPETVQSDDLVEVINQYEEEIYTRESRPLDYVYAIEKGMQQVISDEMINVFGSIVDFNNLIGEPVNYYQENYHDMGKLREIFFSRIKNTPSLIKYVEFYKWIDGAITSMIRQLIPATANFSDKVATVVESHILERNKYWNKFPNVKLELAPPTGGLQLNRAPVSLAPAIYGFSVLPQNQSCDWWKNQAIGSNAYIPPYVFANRGEIVSASHSSFDRENNALVVLKAVDVQSIDGGTIELGVTRQTTKFGSDGYLSINTSSFEEMDCLDDT